MSTDIPGVTIISREGFVIGCVDEFSDELKDIIRQELNTICFGKQLVADGIPEFYSYSKTLKEFLVRYDKATQQRKVGMMGELLSHIFIDRAFPTLKPVNRLFNKEERHIKKGFDLNRLASTKDSIWYGEVKSGEKSKTQTVDAKHKQLLGDAKRDLVKKLTGGEQSLWDNAVCDVSLVLSEKSAKNAAQLLQKDFLSLESNPKEKKKAILISTLFHDSKDTLQEQSVAKHTAKLAAEDKFSDILVLCIQKTTYTKVVDFLRQEANK